MRVTTALVVVIGVASIARMRSARRASASPLKPVTHSPISREETSSVLRSSSRANSRAVAKRSFGSRAVARSTARESASGTSTNVESGGIS